MDSDNKADGGSGQASLTESWDNRDPNPDSGTSEVNSETENEPDANSDTATIDDYTEDTQQPQTQESKGVAITQGPQSVVNSDGVVLPFTRTALDTLPSDADDDAPNSPPDSDNSSDESSAPETKESTTNQNGRVKTRQRPKSVEEETSDRSPMKPISSHAKKASETTTESAGENQEQESEQEAGMGTVTPTGNEIVHKSCPECNADTVTEGTDQFCPDCGVLLADQKIDPGPEWRAFDNTQKASRSRVGGPVKKNIHDKGLSTVIGNDKTDANGKALTTAKKKKMARLRKWDSRFKVKNTKERNLRQAFGEIQRIASEMDLPEYVEETACTVYRRALDEELLPGRSIEAMASASVYIAIRQASIPKTLAHLAEYCRVDESRVTGAYSYLGRELGIEIEPPDVLEYLGRISSELEVKKQTERMAETLLQASVDKKLHSGKAPSGMAAAAVYAATMITRCDRVTQEETCEAGDVCELTIRTRLRELLDAYGVDHEDVSPPSQSEVAETREEMDDETSDVATIEENSPVVRAN